MRKRHWKVALTVAVPVVATGLGAAWGIGAARRVHWLHGQWGRAGVLAVVVLVLECARFGVSRRLRETGGLVSLGCLGLACYAGMLMTDEAFLPYHGDPSFMLGIVRMLPFLVAVGPLVRAGAWMGVAGAALFYATALAMMTLNGMSRTGGYGFFEFWVS